MMQPGAQIFLMYIYIYRRFETIYLKGTGIKVILPILRTLSVDIYNQPKKVIVRLQVSVMGLVLSVTSQT